MTNASGISPLDVKVLVKPDAVEEKTAGGIILADTTKEQKKYAATRGTLIDHGANAFNEWGDVTKPKPGDRVIFAQYAGLRIKGDDGEDVVLMNDEDLVGVAR